MYSDKLIFPHLISSSCGSLKFEKFGDYGDLVEYKSGSLMKKDSLFIKASYDVPKKNLTISSIYNGVSDSKIPNLARLVLKTLIEKLDINSLTFEQVKEPATVELLSNYENPTFNLEELLNYSDSPLLRCFDEFDFTYIISSIYKNMSLSLPNKFGDVTGYKN